MRHEGRISDWKVDRGFGQDLLHTVRGAGYVIRADG